jgi:hypothetical protein
MARNIVNLDSLSIYASDNLSNPNAVSPSISVSTTYKYNDDPDQITVPDKLMRESIRVSFSLLNIVFRKYSG